MSLNISPLYLARLAAIVSILTFIGYPNISKITLPMMCVFTLLSREAYKNFKLCIVNRFVLCAVLLVALFAIGISYSETTLRQALVGFFKYNKLLYTLFLLPIFTEPRWRRIACNALIVAVFVDIIFSLLTLHGIANVKYYPSGYANSASAISASVILAFVSYMLGMRALNEKKYRGYCAILCLTAIYILFFQYIERTGQAVCLVLIGLMLWQKIAWKGLLAALLVVPLLATLLFFTSTSFQHRVQIGYGELMQYVKTRHNEDSSVENSSVGLRLAFAEYSWQVIKEHPWIGTGTGSFKSVYAKTGGPLVKAGEPLQDPHNEYVIVAFQLGFIGLAVFLLMLILQWRDAKKLPMEEQHLAQALILTFIITGFFHIVLFIGLSGLFYVLFSGIFFAASPLPTSNKK